MGAFIVFEGGEGAGKSTQAKILSRRMEEEGYPVVRTREPGGTKLGESIRRLLKARSDVTPAAELLMFATARAQLVQEVISPALKAGSSVVCDRFAASTVAYQGHGRGLDLQLISDLNQVATGGIKPNLTVFLDMPGGAGLARKPNGGKDPFESQGREFHDKVREGYLEMASRDPRGWLVVDGTMAKNSLSRLVWAMVVPLL